MTGLLTRKNLMLLAAAGSLGLILGALFFQMLGFAPCKLCIWQRWPHGVAIAAGALVLILGPRALLGVVGALGALTTGAIGVYHTGIERGWWKGPEDCTGAGDSLSGLSGSDLLSTDLPSDIVMCDEVAWVFLGLSMASWNAIISFGLAAIWIAALRR